MLKFVIRHLQSHISHNSYLFLNFELVFKRLQNDLTTTLFSIYYIGRVSLNAQNGRMIDRSVN